MEEMMAKDMLMDSITTMRNVTRHIMMKLKMVIPSYQHENMKDMPMRNHSQWPMRNHSQWPMRNYSQWPMRNHSNEPMRDHSNEPMRNHSKNASTRKTELFVMLN